MLKKISCTFVSLTMALSFTSCSSSKTKEEASPEVHSDIERDYVVRDASLNARPVWISDTNLWSSSHGDAKFRYFSYETEPKINREVACELAKTNARADIATEIAAFIDKAVGSSVAGAATAGENNQALREFVEVTLAEKTKALIHGDSVEQIYWEKRQYQQSKGAKKDYEGFTCAALIKMDRDLLKKAVDEASQHVVKKVDDPETKENVKNALKNVAEDFDKAKQGVI